MFAVHNFMSSAENNKVVNFFKLKEAIFGNPIENL
jgi:hypothetical protein